MVRELEAMAIIATEPGYLEDKEDFINLSKRLKNQFRDLLLNRQNMVSNIH